MPEPPCSEVDLAARQLAAITAFGRVRRMAEEAGAAVGRTREMRMDADRRLAVLRREHQAVIARTDAALRASGGLLAATAERTVLLAHRSAWYLDQVQRDLEGTGLHVLACLDNGADLVGAAVAEQPDVVLLEETLAMVPGEEVVRELRCFCAGTRIVAQVTHREHGQRLLAAGACLVLPRTSTPGQVAGALRDLVPA